jgi:hypothetical protein
MRLLVRQGRKFRLYLGLGSQDAQVKTLGESSGVRTNFRTNYYVGGDPYTKAAILGLPRNAPDPPGQGVVYLRWPGAEAAQLVRVPLADNAGVTRLLPPLHPATAAATGVATPLAIGGYGPATPPAAAVAAPVADSSHRSQEAQAALALFVAGKSMAEIVLELEGVRSNQGSRYQTALGKVQGLVRQALTGPAEGQESNGTT